MSRQKGNRPPPKTRGRKLHNIQCSAKTDDGRCGKPADVWAIAGWCDTHKPQGV